MDRKMLLVGLLLIFIFVMIVIKQNDKLTLEGYVAAPRARAARVDANTYTGPGDEFRGPVRPAARPATRARARARARAVWYQPWTWGNYFVVV